MNAFFPSGLAARAPSPVTDLLQSAIDAAHRAGGGFVDVPAGDWVTGTLRLRSGVWLRLGPGAVLRGATDINLYPAQPTPAYRSYHDRAGYRALIYAEGETNVGLTGPGLIDGQGEAFPFRSDEHDCRPRLIQFISCRDVTVEGLRLLNAGMWMQHYLNCERVVVRDLRVWNHANHNNDMMDIDGCRGVFVSGCVSDTDDDGITLKSTGPAACEDVVISDCVISSRCNAIKLGTESTGGFRNISISRCIVRPTRHPARGVYGHPEGICGVALEVVDGGVMENVSVSGITIEGTRSPLFIRLANRARRHRPDAVRPGLGAVRGLVLRDIVARGAGNIGCSITGIPGAWIEDVDISGLQIINAVPAPESDGTLPAERLDEYPEATMFGPLPAHGMFIRHARGVRLRGCRFVAAAGDLRPAVVTDDVEDLLLDDAPLSAT